MSAQNTRLGILLMIATAFVLAVQDAISRHLAEEYSIVMAVTIRYWVFAGFVLLVSARQPGGLRAVAATRQPVVHILRGLLLVAEILTTVAAFVLLGLIPTHAIFASYPLIIAALSGPLLGERVGPLRWVAIAAGFVGILVILRPGLAVFEPLALIPLGSAFLWAGYGLLTRYAARRDSAQTSFFWTGMVGAAVMTLIGPWFWQPMSAADWGWMAALSVAAVLAQALLIKAYDLAEASAVQPFAYFQLVFIILIAVPVFGERVDLPTLIGGAIVVGAGLFTAWRERQLAQRQAG